MKIFSIQNSKKIAEAVADIIGLELGKVTKKKFKDGEFTVGYNESVRNQKVYIIGSTNIIRGDDNLMELCMMIRAAKLANAASITVIIPYFGWGRADRKDIERSCVTSKLVAEFIENAGATHAITFDLHAIQTQSFFNIPSDHFTLDKLYSTHIKENYDISEVVLAAPDLGAAKRVSKVAGLLSTNLIINYKERNSNNDIQEMLILGNVKDKIVVYIDDICDSGGTLCKAAALAKQNGAKKVIAYCSHGVLSGNAITDIQKSDIDDFYITDSINCDAILDNTKIKQLNMAKVISNIINKINNDLSLSAI